MERTYAHIDPDERRKIPRWRAANLSVDIIAEKLGRHRSTVFRELKRNRFVYGQITDLTGYYGMVADQKSVNVARNNASSSGLIICVNP